MITVIILGILSGMLMLVFGGSSDKARATGIAAELESVKQAALAYEARHKTRNDDPLASLMVTPAAFTSAVNAILEKPLPAGRQASLVRENGRLHVAFDSIQADDSLSSALNRFVSQHGDGGYSGRTVSGGYSLRLLLK
jgi:type II secretory pathway pseudopilin PulG